MSPVRSWRSTLLRSAMFMPIFAMLALVACSERGVVEPPVSPLASVSAGRPSVDNRYIVILRTGTDPRAAASQLLPPGSELHHVYASVFPGFAVTLPPNAIQALSRNPLVVATEQDQVVQVESGAQDGAVWGLDRTDQVNRPLDGWFRYSGLGSGVTAYIVDTGIHYSHDDFEGRASLGADVVGGGMNGGDCNGHGTHVAGTVGGATYGIAKGVALKSVRVLGCDGKGTISGLIAGIDWIRANAAKPAVANMSVGAGLSSSLNTATRNLINSGVQVTVSAGNNTTDACTASPASTAEAITVAASTSTDARASFSNFGACVDLFAPGARIVSAYHTSNTATANLSGTSMSAPHVAGVAAILLQHRPAISPQALRDTIVFLSTKNIVSDARSENAHLLFLSATGVTAPTTAPSAPTNLTAAAPGTSVALAWTNTATNATEVVVQRQVETSGWTVIAQLSPAATTYTDDAVQQGTTYSYRVSASSSAGTSSPSNVAAVTVPGPPTAPSNLSAALSGTSVSLQWQNTASNAASVVVEQRTGASSWAAIATLAATATSYTDAATETGTTYTYRVYASNSAGNSPASNEAAASIPSPPSAPTSLGGGLSGGAVALSWTNTASNATGVVVERQVGTGSWTEIATLGAAATQYTDATVQAGTTYSYRVYATGVAGNSGASNTVSVSIPQSVPVPNAPASLTASVNKQTVRLSWKDRAANEDGFVIERRTGSGDWETLVLLSANATSYQDNDTAPNATYRYRVAAFNSAGQSGWSNEVSATTRR
jgi:subtilisin family serine protease